MWYFHHYATCKWYFRKPVSNLLLTGNSSGVCQTNKQESSVTDNTLLWKRFYYGITTIAWLIMIMSYDNWTNISFVVHLLVRSLYSNWASLLKFSTCSRCRSTSWRRHWRCSSSLVVRTKSLIMEMPLSATSLHTLRLEITSFNLSNPTSCGHSAGTLSNHVSTDTFRRSKRSHDPSSTKSHSSVVLSRHTHTPS